MTTNNSFSDVFDALQDAILQNSSVLIKYKKFVGTRTTRTIDPKRFVLVERRRNKYHRICVNAFCHLRQDYRTFAVHRIEELVNNQ